LISKDLSNFVLLAKYDKAGHTSRSDAAAPAPVCCCNLMALLDAPSRSCSCVAALLQMHRHIQN